MKIVTVVGARPQFIKAATVSRALLDAGVDEVLIHTGQHFDANMSDVFFDELRIPRPAHHLGIGGGSHGQQTGRMMEQLDAAIRTEQPRWMLVYGDTNSTLAAALAAVKLHVPVAHVEAGLRSFNRRMPEEINRIVADAVSDLLLCPTAVAVENLRREGVTRGVHQTGDVMYDSVRFNLELARAKTDPLSRLGLRVGEYYLATIHRAENTDDASRLAGILTALERLPRLVVLPLHPRTAKSLAATGRERPANVRLIEPVGYLDMLRLEASARLILTDSGGVQKEAFFVGRPCVTLREQTEWTELLDAGANILTGADPDCIVAAVEQWEGADARLPAACDDQLYGDGHAAEQVAGLLQSESPVWFA